MKKAVDPNFYQQRRKTWKVSLPPQRRRVRLLHFGRDDVQPLKVLCAAGHQEPRLQLWTKLPPRFFFSPLWKGGGGGDGE